LTQLDNQNDDEPAAGAAATLLAALSRSA